MTIAYAALHTTLRYRDEDTNLFVAAFDDGRMFLSRRQPPLYDRKARPVAPREVLPGSYVNIRYAVERGVKLMEAVQVVNEPRQDSPFDPVPLDDDGHL
jgi:hypothetical protein